MLSTYLYTLLTVCVTYDYKIINGIYIRKILH